MIVLSDVNTLQGHWVREKLKWPSVNRLEAPVFYTKDVIVAFCFIFSLSGGVNAVLIKGREADASGRGKEVDVVIEPFASFKPCLWFL